MLFAGLVTDKSVSALGAIVSIAAVIGWFRAVLPHEAHAALPIVPEAPATAMRRLPTQFSPLLNGVGMDVVPAMPRNGTNRAYSCGLELGCRRRGRGPSRGAGADRLGIERKSTCA